MAATCQYRLLQSLETNESYTFFLLFLCWSFSKFFLCSFFSVLLQCYKTVGSVGFIMQGLIYMMVWNMSLLISSRSYKLSQFWVCNLCLWIVLFIFAEILFLFSLKFQLFPTYIFVIQKYSWDRFQKTMNSWDPRGSQAFSKTLYITESLKPFLKELHIVTRSLGEMLYCDQNKKI